MQFRPFAPGIEVSGQAVWSLVDAFSPNQQTPSRVLAEAGIGQLGEGGVLKLDPKGWYSQEAWLKAFERIAATLGSQVLFAIGQRIPQNAVFPPTITDLDSALRAIDVAYHLNHRKDGQVMFDAATLTMASGIGHYAYERPHPDKPLIVLVCRNPYPCEFDRGVVTALARRFEPAASLVHLDEHLCRSTGGDECTYHVKW